MKLSKTQVFAWLSIVTGFLTSLGIDVPVEALESAVGAVFDNAVAGVMIVYGAIQLWLRTATDSAVYKGLKGLLFKEDSGE